MSTPFLVLFGIAFGAAAWGVMTYNKLVRLRNLKEEGWSGIEVQLKRRSNLIPNLIETVKGYMGHEEKVMTEVTKLRTRAGSASGTGEQIHAEAALGLGLGRLLAVAEEYPDLKANENFLDLQHQLQKIEDELQMARRYYNGTVRVLNIIIEIFPNSIVAGLFHFEKAEFFEIDDDEDREVPQVSFSG